MNSVPRIEVHLWSVQQPPQQPRSSAYIPYRPGYLHEPSTVSCEIDNRRSQEQEQPSIPKSPPRYTIWSSLRRSKSADAVSNKTGRSPAQPARRCEKLVWCPERKIWLFPREEEVIYMIDGKTQTPQKKKRSISANFLSLPSSWRKRGEVDEEGMRFAQLPGHYGLNVYDYPGNTLLQRSTEDLGTYGSSSLPVAESMAMTTTISDEPLDSERGWMSVASRLSGHSPR